VDVGKALNVRFSSVEALQAQEHARYRPALDGIRGLAVFGVLMFHSSSHEFLNGLYPGGGYGVSVFFVLSGYLITSLLLTEHAKTGTVSLKNFYIRRALRLLPALAMLIGYTVFVVAILGHNADGRRLYIAVIPVLFYVGNWAVAANSKQLGLFGHTWTLAIEEQFYVFWPPILKRALRRDPTARRLAVGLVAAIVAISAYRAFVTLADFHKIYQQVWDFDGLLFGSLLAVYLDRIDTGALRRRLQSPQLALAAAAVLFVLTIVMPGTTFERIGGVTLLYVTTGVLVAYASLADQRLGLNRVLSFKPLAELGRISYGVYLFHPATNALVHSTRIAGWPVGVEVAIHQTLSIAVAAASYLLVERRILALKARFQPLDKTVATVESGDRAGS
jgi:peptidoglycan/LPS O-acetylase OafA/YrhL